MKRSQQWTRNKMGPQRSPPPPTLWLTGFHSNSVCWNWTKKHHWKEAVILAFFKLIHQPLREEKRQTLERWPLLWTRLFQLPFLMSWESARSFLFPGDFLKSLFYHRVMITMVHQGLCLLCKVMIQSDSIRRKASSSGTLMTRLFLREQCEHKPAHASYHCIGRNSSFEGQK